MVDDGAFHDVFRRESMDGLHRCHNQHTIGDAVSQLRDVVEDTIDRLTGIGIPRGMDVFQRESVRRTGLEACPVVDQALDRVEEVVQVLAEQAVVPGQGTGAGVGRLHRRSRRVPGSRRRYRRYDNGTAACPPETGSK